MCKKIGVLLFRALTYDRQSFFECAFFEYRNPRLVILSKVILSLFVIRLTGVITGTVVMLTQNDYTLSSWNNEIYKRTIFVVIRRETVQR